MDLYTTIVVSPIGVSEAVSPRSSREPATVDMDTPRPIGGSYDAASLDGMNTRHWLAADALDADSANSKTVRQRISRRARYELSNNGQGKGVQLTQANYVVGRGPKLRMQTGSPRFNSMIEAEWKRWAKEAKLAKKLRTTIKAKVSDGEPFFIITQNPKMRHRVKLGLRMVECEQVTTPYLGANEPNKIDGIEFDEYGNVLFYDVLKHHPGSQWSGLGQEVDQVPARFMLHLFREDRAGQHRGVSEVAPSLNCYAQGRRFREAVLVGAENIANFSLFLKTQADPSIETDIVRPLSTYPMEKGMMTALPAGYDGFQPKPEQPSATYKDFTREQSGEQARPLNMPNNIARADSSGYSFSGGKLDHLTYFVSVDVEQQDVEEDVLDPLFAVWFAEAVHRFGWGVPDDPPPNHGWDWPEKPVIDEVKHANANKTNLSTGVAVLRRVYAQNGLDLEEELPRMAEDYGITVDEMRAALFEAHFGRSASAQQSDDKPISPPTQGRNRLATAGRNGNRVASR
jgi:capsid protein